MARFGSSTELLETLSAPVGDLIASIGINIAHAQKALDGQAIANFMEIYGEGGSALKELRKIGYQPTWYHFPETKAEIKVALTVSGEAESRVSTEQTTGPTLKGGPTRLKLYAAPVDGTYAGKFNYELKAATTVAFKVVPVPPPLKASNMKVAPEVSAGETTVAQAKELLEDLEISYEIRPGEAINDEDVITGQDPAPGELILEGEHMTLTVD